MKGPVCLMKHAWNYLSMVNDVPILFEGYLYKNMYKLMYSVAFPSRREEICSMGMIRLKDLQLGLKYFEIEEKEVIDTLMKVIIHQCETDPLFLSKLKKTKDRKIIYNDYADKYFGGTRNIYGLCLMKVRDERLYLKNGDGGEGGVDGDSDKKKNESKV